MESKPMHYGYVNGSDVIWVCDDRADVTKILPLTDIARNTQCPKCKEKITALENTDDQRPTT